MTEFEMTGYVDWFETLNHREIDGEWFTAIDWDCVEIDRMPATVWDGCAATVCPLEELPAETQATIQEAEGWKEAKLWLVVDGWVSPLFSYPDLQEAYEPA